MGIFSIKDHLNDFYAKVDDEGNLYVKTSGGGSLTDVNIFDSAGNPLTSTGGSLNVNSGGIGWTLFGQSTPKQVSVAAVSTQILAANSNRLFARIMNNSGALIYMQYGIPAVWQEGVPIAPNAGYNITTDELYLGAIYVINLTGTVLIDVLEGVSS